MKNKILIIPASLILILFTSCTTTLDFKVPSNRFHTAEVSGRTLGGRLELGHGRGHEIELAKLYEGDILDNDPRLTTNEAVSDATALTLNLSLGIIEELDFYYFDYHDAADIFGLKYQFLGEIGSDKEGNKLALMIGSGHGTDNEYSTFKVDENDETYRGKLDTWAYEIALAYTYRFTKNFSVYSTFTHSIYKVKGFIEGDDIDDFETTGYARTNIFLAGVDLATGPSKDVGIMIESGISKTTWQTSLENTDYPLGLNLYFKW